MRSHERTALSRGERVARGVSAKAMLDSALLNEAFDTIEAEIYEVFLAAAHDNDALRRSCQDRIAAIRDVRQQLKSLMITGEQAALHGGDDSP